MIKFHSTAHKRELLCLKTFSILHLLQTLLVPGYVDYANCSNYLELQECEWVSILLIKANLDMATSERVKRLMACDLQSVRPRRFQSVGNLWRYELFLYIVWNKHRHRYAVSARRRQNQIDLVYLAGARRRHFQIDFIYLAGTRRRQSEIDFIYLAGAHRRQFSNRSRLNLLKSAIDNR